MKLVIVESPTKAKKINQYLGSKYQVRASMGHVRDLPKSKLGVDVENDFEPHYVAVRRQSKNIKELKGLAKKSDAIILATDPDREGEAIAWHLMKAIKDDSLASKSQRAVFHEITKQAVEEAIAKPGEININLVDAQQARRVLDRLVGYQLSPILWKKIRTGLSAGRVQSVALRLIVEREAEIEAFDPDEYWEVDLELGVAGQEQIIARVIKVNNKKYEPTKAEQVEAVEAWAKEAAYQVKTVERKQRKRKPYPPFTTSTLQQQAASRLGFSSKQTMTLAQQLYEQGLITYHRTDSFNLSAQAISLAREYIKKEFGDSYLPAKANVYKSKSKNAQEAHEAIRPTSANPQPDMEGKLDEKHAKLYDLIFRRFVASQMVPAVYDLTTILVDGQHQDQQLEARCSGSVITMPGWMKLFPSNSDTILPAVEDKQTLDFKKFVAEQKFTQPPARFNDASLVKELEKRGIGRPSTYSSIIEVLLNRRYVRRESRAFIPTTIGVTVAKFLIKYFDKIMDYDFTAKMEDELDEIARGEKQWVKVIKDFYQPFSGKLEEVGEKADRMQVPVEPMNKPCPKCGVSEKEFARLMEKGQTVSTRPDDWEAPRTEDGKIDKGEHGELVVRTGRYGKFISCSRYPDCDYTANYELRIGLTCPDCGEGEVVEKTTRKGRTFYGCNRYPKCKFASWKNPLEEQKKSE